MNFISPTMQKTLSERFGSRLKENVSLAGFNDCPSGWIARYINHHQFREELAETANLLWDSKYPLPGFRS